MKQRTVAVGCWGGVLVLSAVIARDWWVAGLLVVWTGVAMGLANGDA